MNLHPSSLTRRALLGGVLTGAMLQANLGMARPLLESSPAFRISRGINFHHMLNWPAARNVDGNIEYAWPPYEGERHATTDDELLQLRHAGFDFIRLTTDPGIWLASDDNQAAELAKMTHSLVERLIGAGFNVVLDL